MVVVDIEDSAEVYIAAEYITTVKETFDASDRNVFIFGMSNGTHITVHNSQSIPLEEVVTRIFAEKSPLSQVKQLL